MSGGTTRAAGGELTFMASGSAEAFAARSRCSPPSPRRSKVRRSARHRGRLQDRQSVARRGPHRCRLRGDHVRKKLGLDIEKVFEVITASAGNSWMFENRIPHVLAGDYRPASAVDIFAKDLGIVADIGRVEKFPTPMAANALQLFLMTSAAGMGRDDDASVARMIARVTGLDLPTMSSRDPARRQNCRRAESECPAIAGGARLVTALMQVRELNVLIALLVVVALISSRRPTS